MNGQLLSFCGCSSLCIDRKIDSPISSVSVSAVEADDALVVSAVEGSLAGKKVALFGSYGWGDGQWMRDWCERAGSADLYDEEGLAVNEADQETCRDLARKLAAWTP
jgi:hypothetical protein